MLIKVQLFEVFKILNGYKHTDNIIFVSVKQDRRTRGHISLPKEQCRLDIRKFSCSQRTVNEWNILYLLICGC